MQIVAQDSKYVVVFVPPIHRFLTSACTEVGMALYTGPYTVLAEN